MSIQLPVPPDQIRRPSPDQPGTWAQQIAAAGIAIYLGERRQTSAAAEWQDARRLVIPHANGRPTR